MRSTLLFVWVLLSALCAAEILVQVKSGGTASLRCGISDSVSDLKWLRSNQPVYTINPRTGMNLKGQGEIVKRCIVKSETELKISHVTPGDAGLFTCKVKDIEEQHRLVVSAVSAFPSGPLESGSSVVLRCEAFGLGEGSSVQWQGPDGRRNEKATVTLSHVTTEDSGLWECLITTSGRTMRDSVTIQIREPTPLRETTTLPPVKTVTVDNETCLNCVTGETSSEATPSSLVLGLSWWVWAALGGGPWSVVVLLWVLILIMYNQKIRRKRRFMKMQKAALLKQKTYCQCPGPTAVKGQCRTKPPAPPLSLI